MSDIEIKGLEELSLKLKDMVSDESVANALERACALVERSAKQKAPKGRTGDLRKFIAYRIQGKEGIVYSPLEYAPYVEYGTGIYAENGGRTDVPWAFIEEETGKLIWTAGQHPMPFMRPALDENRAEIVEIFKQEGILK